MKHNETLQTAYNDEITARHRTADEAAKKRDNDELADGKVWEWWTDGSGRLYIQPKNIPTYPTPWIPLDELRKALGL
jgi:hypothetical protein